MSPPPSQTPSQPPNSTPNPSAARPKLARRACDSCKVRKIRCSEIPPCNGCTASGIECTFNRLQATRGPRGLRAKTLDKIDRRRRGDEPASRCRAQQRRNATPEEAPAQIDGQSQLVSILDIYAERLFPIWPIVDALDLKRKLLERPGPDNAVLPLVHAVALAAIAQLKLESSWQPRIEEVESDGLGERFDALDSLRISFFLHIFHENALPGGTKSLIYLREAVTQAQILRLDRESTYATLSDTRQQVSRRVLWLLFVTER